MFNDNTFLFTHLVMVSNVSIMTINISWYMHCWDYIVPLINLKQSLIHESLSRDMDIGSFKPCNNALWNIVSLWSNWCSHFFHELICVTWFVNCIWMRKRDWYGTWKQKISSASMFHCQHIWTVKWLVLWNCWMNEIR